MGNGRGLGVLKIVETKDPAQKASLIVEAGRAGVRATLPSTNIADARESGIFASKKHVRANKFPESGDVSELQESDIIPVTLDTLTLFECSDYRTDIEMLGELSENEAVLSEIAKNISASTVTGSLAVFENLRTAPVKRADRINLLKAYKLHTNKVIQLSDSEQSRSCSSADIIVAHRTAITELAYEVAYQILECPRERAFLLLAAQASLPRMANRNHQAAIGSIFTQQLNEIEKANKSDWAQRKSRLRKHAEATFMNLGKTIPPPLAHEAYFFKKALAQVEAENTLQVDHTTAVFLTPLNTTVAERDQTHLESLTLTTEEASLIRPVQILCTKTAAMEKDDLVAHYKLARAVSTSWGEQETPFVRMFHAARPKPTAATREIDGAFLEHRYIGSIRELAMQIVVDNIHTDREVLLDTAFASLPSGLHLTNKAHLRAVLLREIKLLDTLVNSKWSKIQELASEAAFTSVVAPMRFISVLTELKLSLQTDLEQKIFAAVLQSTLTDLQGFAKEIKDLKATARGNNTVDKLREDLNVKKRIRSLDTYRAANFTKLHRIATQDITSLMAFLTNAPAIGTAEHVDSLARYTALAFTPTTKTKVLNEAAHLVPQPMREHFFSALNRYVTHFDRLEKFVLKTITNISDSPDQHENILMQAVQGLGVLDYRDFYSYYDRYKHLIRPRRLQYAPFQTPGPSVWKTVATTVATHAKSSAKVVARTMPYLPQGKWLVLVGALLSGHAGLPWIPHTVNEPAPTERVPAEQLLRYTTNPHSVFMGFNPTTGQARAMLLDGAPLPNVEAMTLRTSGIVYLPVEITVDREPVNVHSALFGFMNGTRFHEAYPNYQPGATDQSNLLNNATGRLRYIQTHIAKNDKLTFGFNTNGNIVISGWRRGRLELINTPIEIDCSTLSHLGNFAFRPQRPTPAVNAVPLTAMTPIGKEGRIGSHNYYAFLKEVDGIKHITPIEAPIRVSTWDNMKAWGRHLWRILSA